MAGAARGEARRQRPASRRTVTTKVRYPDFSTGAARRRFRSARTTAERITELACALLDRALAERPGALRLVGVTVSNLETGVQLPLE